MGADLSEAWAKRRYPAHFLSKLTDADGELQETLHWLSTAAACRYLTDIQFHGLADELGILAKRLGSMIRGHESFFS